MKVSEWTKFDYFILYGRIAEYNFKKIKHWIQEKHGYIEIIRLPLQIYKITKKFKKINPES